MTTPDDTPKRSPVDRFRNILSDDQEKEQAPAARKYPKGTISPSLMNLPRAKQPAGTTSNTSPVSSLPPLPPPDPAIYRADGNRFLPAFWTAASVISLLVNAILFVLVVALLRNLGSLNATGLGSGLLGGLFTN